ncbi:hypothetical protein I9W82_000911 [Candida metapsilosis]|uniref:UBX domain-containing protein n=1 Tax=Candida metapsilosis TaxID=273372 RepID=A0A8H8DDE3_9ASCO|nr:hypothetical protein I9W82_000911 [Candida metapsilosis]
MPDMDRVFHSSVQEAVQLTVQNKKSLFVFLASPDDSTNDSFLSKFIKDQTISQLRENSVPLKLIRGSVEYGYFEQLFKNLIVPSFYVVSQGKLEAVITSDSSEDDFDKCIQSLSARLRESTDTSTSPPEVPTALSSQPSSGSVPQTAITSTPNNQESTRSQSNDDDDEHEKSVLRHRKIVEQQRKEKLAEKRRLRELLEADKRERQSRERAEKELFEESKPSLPTSSKSSSHTNCLLAIKLFDGSTIKHDFKPEDTLTTVRTFLDEEVKIIPSTSSMPSFASTSYPTGYSFHRPALPRVTYSEEQESHSLVDLDLTPRSILILKPTYDQTNSNNNAPGNEKVGILRTIYNFVTGIGSALYSFFDYGVEDVHRQVNAEPPAPLHQTEEEVIDLHQPIAPGLLSVGDRGLSSSLINIERDDRGIIAATPVESRASSPRPPLSRVQTIHDDARDLRDTYNGNSINLRDDDQAT